MNNIQVTLPTYKFSRRLNGAIRRYWQFYNYMLFSPKQVQSLNAYISKNILDMELDFRGVVP